jgi:Lar family restriction alleviation protein
MTEQLKPCPFCGTKKILKRAFSITLEGTNHLYWAECYGCGATSSRCLSEELSDKKWNQRAYEKK